MDRQDLVPVYTVNNPTEAEIVRAALESAGIACEIGGETQGGFAGVFEIDILAHASDAEQARKYLRELKHITKQERRKAHEEAKQAKESAALKEAIEEHNPNTGIQLPPDAPA